MKKQIPADLAKMSLDRLFENFSRTGNAIFALKAFLLAHETKRSIPEWVIDHLARGIDFYLKGKVNSLDIALHLKRCGKGRWTSPLEKVSNERRNSNLVFFMVVLETVFGYKIQDAIIAVYNKFGSEAMLSERTLADLHAVGAMRMRATLKSLMQNMDISTAKKIWNFLV